MASGMKLSFEFHDIQFHLEHPNCHLVVRNGIAGHIPYCCQRRVGPLWLTAMERKADEWLVKRKFSFLQNLLQLYELLERHALWLCLQNWLWVRILHVGFFRTASCPLKFLTCGLKDKLWRTVGNTRVCVFGWVNVHACASVCVCLGE